MVTALVWLGLAELGRRLPSPSRRVGQVTAGVLVALVLIAIVLAHPIRQFDTFKSNAAVGHAHGTATTNHLLNTSGSGRWQFWTAAVSEFKAHPLNGGGAGSWLAWWLQHPVIPAFTQYAHSLYLESLAELGIIGLLLIGCGRRGRRRGRGPLGAGARERRGRGRRCVRHRVLRRRRV